MIRALVRTGAELVVVPRVGLPLEEGVGALLRYVELSHHSLVQYRLPTTGELVPLLQIVPSKTDTERLLLVSPELADVLSAIICRVRNTTGAVPLVPSYDRGECVWPEPAPLLFQRRICGEDRAFTDETVSTMLDQALIDTGLTYAAGTPLRYTPHDFRRLFITDAVLNGLPPHHVRQTCVTCVAYQEPFPAGSRMATHSTWCVIGNKCSTQFTQSDNCHCSTGQWRHDLDAAFPLTHPRASHRQRGRHQRKAGQHSSAPPVSQTGNSAEY
ncbi:hypothetical protein [Streptomyces noursei]|uniref:hypothetical protein n=1 Tax=Streptomyces noursei TaxID=1971 RepID=UPI0023B7DB52|nr:hypothetical protein [Streptomyces noursei]